MLKRAETLIQRVSALEVLDSRGNPTVCAKVVLMGGAVGEATVPSGASTGKYEALEKRDGGDRYGGRGVLGAVNAVNSEIGELLVGKNALDQAYIDDLLRKADGTCDKSRFGANAILSVSMAVLRAGADACDLPLYRYVGGVFARTMPIPMMNVLNGGAHADNPLDVQEFMIVPHGFADFGERIRAGVTVYHALKQILKEKGLSTAVGDEGGFAPALKNDTDALDLLVKAIGSAGFIPGKEISLALDVASSEWFDNGIYRLPKAQTVFSADELSSHYSDLLRKYPIVSIEDPFSEDDFPAYQRFDPAGKDVMIVGDDLFVTNTSRIKEGIAKGAANAVLIKPNQIGTVSETFDAVRLAEKSGYKTVMSHRSADTEDSTIADLAVGLSCGFIKTGAPARSERVSKYNRLLKIGEELSESAILGDK